MGRKKPPAEARPTLPELAGRINAKHEACLAAAQDAIALAIETGRLLEEAKRQVQHGEWAGWIESNCSFGIREAQSLSHKVNIWGVSSVVMA
jgi:hypothetical protein